MSQQDKDRPTESWKLHDSYREGISVNRIVTRSQTAFLRLQNTPSDVELFADKDGRQDPPGKPPLMVAIKGPYGSVPRTTLTRDVGKEVGVDKGLCATVDAYKAAGQETHRASVFWFL